MSLSRAASFVQNRRISLDTCVRNGASATSNSRGWWTGTAGDAYRGGWNDVTALQSKYRYASSGLNRRLFEVDRAVDRAKAEERRRERERQQRRLMSQ